MIRACPTCGVIYAPRNAPPACPDCGGQLVSVTIPMGLTLARERQDRLRAARRDRDGRRRTRRAA